MKGINSTGAPLVHVPGWMDGWMDGWVGVKAVLRIAYSNQQITKQKTKFLNISNQIVCSHLYYTVLSL
jgi:hypothetical protein